MDVLDPPVPRRDPTVKMLDVAAAAGVSRSTVSNVMRGSSTVAEAVRERVLEQARQLGYVYNRGAAGLRSQQSHLIGLVIPDAGNPFIAEAARGVQDVLRRFGYFVVTSSTGEDLREQRRVLSTLGEHRVDGVLLIPALGVDAAVLGADLGGLPAVLVNRAVEGLDVPYVGPDESAVGELAAEHLLVHHGCRSVAYLGGPASASPRIQRVTAFRAAATGAGAEFVEAWSSPSEPTPRAAYEVARGLLSVGSPPEGVHCHSDSIAYGLLRALREVGIGPDRCRVIAADDVEASDFFAPRVTSVSVDAVEIGRVAAGRLLDLVGEPVGEDTGPLDAPIAHLVVRESCGCAA